MARDRYAPGTSFWIRSGTTRSPRRAGIRRSSCKRTSRPFDKCVVGCGNVHRKARHRIAVVRRRREVRGPASGRASPATLSQPGGWLDWRTTRLGKSAGRSARPRPRLRLTGVLRDRPPRSACHVRCLAHGSLQRDAARERHSQFFGESLPTPLPKISLSRPQPEQTKWSCFDQPQVGCFNFGTSERRAGCRPPTRFCGVVTSTARQPGAD